MMYDAVAAQGQRQRVKRRREELFMQEQRALALEEAAMEDAEREKRFTWWFMMQHQ